MQRRQDDAKLDPVVRGPAILSAVLITGFISVIPGAAAEAGASVCANELTRQLPARADGAATGSALVDRLAQASGPARDAVIASEVLSGNIPGFLRRLAPVRLSGALDDGRKADVVVCVMPDYLAVGSNADFVRVPLGLPAAAEIADRLGFLLPTTRMVDAIYRQARIHFKPSPMKPGNSMRSTAYLWRHNQTVERQRSRFSKPLDALSAGQKKDLVLSNRLRIAPGRVAIYGWHRMDGEPIQPLSTVHGARYADYSHGVRLVSATAFVNGVALPLARLLESTRLAPLLSSEGPIADTGALLRSLHETSARAYRAASAGATAVRN